MHSYHPDTPHDSRRAPAEVFASDEIRSSPTYSLGLRATGLLPRPLSFSSLWLSWRQSWRSHKGEVLSCVQQSFHPHRHQGVLEGNTLHASTSGWFARRSTTWIIRTLVGGVLSYVYTFGESDVPQASGVANLMKRLIAWVDSKGWFKRLIQKVDPKVGKLIRKVR